MPATLTPNASSRLGDANDYAILLASPVVQVVGLSGPTTEGVAGGFTIDQLATITDGNDRVQVLFVKDLRTFGIGKDMPREVRVGDLITVQRMIRVPYGGVSAVLVHDVEICSGNEVDLVVTEYDVEINRLKKELADTRARLEMLTSYIGDRDISSVGDLFATFDRMVAMVLAGSGDADQDMADQA